MKINADETPESPQSPTSRSKFSHLQPILNALSKASTLSEALDYIVTGITKALSVDLCSVYLNDHQNTSHKLLASNNTKNLAEANVQTPMNQGLAGYISQNVETVNVANSQNHPSLGKDNSLINDDEFHGFLGVPIIHRGDTLGVLTVQRKARKSFGKSSEVFLQTLAAQAGIWIALAKVHGELVQDEKTSLPKSEYVEGLVGSPGIAFGQAVVVVSSVELNSIPNRDISDVEEETKRFHQAIDVVIASYRDLAAQTQQSLGEQEATLFEAYAAIAASPEIRDRTLDKIRLGQWAPSALREIITEYAAMFRRMEDAYLSERARDVEEIGQRILYALLEDEQQQPNYESNTILVGDNLSPADLMSVPPEKLKAIISGQGSTHSHLAILARALNVPALLGLGANVPIADLDGKSLVVDAYNGKLFIEPSTKLIKQFTDLIDQQEKLSLELSLLRDQPAMTKDGHRVTLLTNAGMTLDLTHSEVVGSEGIGLYRTELPFIHSEYFLTEDDQFSLYSQVLEQSPGTVTFRTLDIGGDKPLPYWPIEEENPFLGWRGIRISLDQPELFAGQIKALLRAGTKYGKVKILLPMVSCIDDLDGALDCIARVRSDLTQEGIQVPDIPIGVMVEVPAMIYLLPLIAKRVDFLSIGSNDLTQYLLAVDRNNPSVERWYSPFNPAVIHALNQINGIAKTHAIPISLCGEAAGDLRMVILLMGMGMNTLSLAAGDLPKVKKLILSLSQQDAHTILQNVLAMTKASDIIHLLTDEIHRMNLGALIGQMDSML